MKPRQVSLWARMALVAWGLLWPVASHACAVCFSGSVRSRLAFFGTTVVMSLLPLGLIGSGLWWLRRGGGWLAGEFEDRDAYAPPQVEASAPESSDTSAAPDSPRS